MTQEFRNAENPDSSARSNQGPKPWYRQLWPWVIILLPASSVVAGLTTLWIAITNQDAVVSDNWYREGKAINQSFASEQRATAFGLVAQATWRAGQKVICIEMSSGGSAFKHADYPLLHLLLQHPTLEDQDISLRLPWHESTGEWCATLALLPEGRFHASLQPIERQRAGNDSYELPWRLHRPIVIDGSRFQL